jgi:hypothetical protein
MNAEECAMYRDTYQAIGIIEAKKFQLYSHWRSQDVLEDYARNPELFLEPQKTVDNNGTQSLILTKVSAQYQHDLRRFSEGELATMNPGEYVFGEYHFQDTGSGLVLHRENGPAIREGFDLSEQEFWRDGLPEMIQRQDALIQYQDGLLRTYSSPTVSIECDSSGQIMRYKELLEMPDALKIVERYTSDKEGNRVIGSTDGPAVLLELPNRAVTLYITPDKGEQSLTQWLSDDPSRQERHAALAVLADPGAPERDRSAAFNTVFNHELGSCSTAMIDELIDHHLDTLPYQDVHAIRESLRAKKTEVTYSLAENPTLMR